MKIYPETVALVVLVLASAAAGFWLADAMMKDRARNPHDPLHAVVTSKPAPTSEPERWCVTNNTPVVNRTNSIVIGETSSRTLMVDAFDTGLRFGSAAAWNGATKDDIEHIGRCFNSNRLDLITAWFDAHR